MTYVFLKGRYTSDLESGIFTPRGRAVRTPEGKIRTVEGLSVQFRYGSGSRLVDWAHWWVCFGGHLTVPAASGLSGRWPYELEVTHVETATKVPMEHHFQEVISIIRQRGQWEGYTRVTRKVIAA